MRRMYEKSELLYNKAVSLIPGGVNSPVRAFKHVAGKPIFFKKASGSTFVDADGNKYVDFCQSWGPLILGHTHPKVVKSVIEAAEEGLSFGACHEKEIELAELILAGFPGHDRVRIMNSGTEAVMTALRIARGVTNRDLVVKFEGGYHGHFDGMLVKAGSGLATHGIASSNGIPHGVAGTTIVTGLDDEESVSEVFNKYGDKIAAIIIEPLPANNGLLVQRKAFLEFLRTTTRKYGSLLIFDEVISGFRLHFGGYCHTVGIGPDIVTLGKIIGGGMPIGAVVGRAAEMECLSPMGTVYQAGTLSGNPISLAAGIATLNIVKSDDVYQKLEKLGNAFEKVIAKSSQVAVQVQRVGSILWLYLDKADFPRRPDDISETAVENYKRIYWDMLDSGYYLPPSSLEVMFVSSAHSEEQMKSFAECVLYKVAKTGDGN